MSKFDLPFMYEWQNVRGILGTVYPNCRVPKNIVEWKHKLLM